MAALGVLTALFDGTKQFLMVAEDRLVTSSELIMKREVLSPNKSANYDMIMSSV